MAVFCCFLFLFSVGEGSCFSFRRFPVGLATTSSGKRLLVRLAGGVFVWVPFRGSSRGGESERGRVEARRGAAPGEGPLTFGAVWCRFGLSWLSFCFSSAQNRVFPY